MQKYGYGCVCLILAVATSAFAGVNVTTPWSGSTVGTSVRLRRIWQLFDL